MAELLQDNNELDRKATSTSTDPATSTTKTPKKCELLEDVQGLLSWVECFNTYLTIIVSKHPCELPDHDGERGEAF